MGEENDDGGAYLGWFKSGRNMLWALFELSMGQENTNRGIWDGLNLAAPLFRLCWSSVWESKTWTGVRI